MKPEYRKRYEEMMARTVPINLNAEELEFLWCIAYAVTLGQVPAHAKYMPIAVRLEPLLYRGIQELAPGFESPLKAKHKH